MEIPARSACEGGRPSMLTFISMLKLQLIHANFNLKMKPAFPQAHSYFLGILITTLYFLLA